MMMVCRRVGAVLAGVVLFAEPIAAQLRAEVPTGSHILVAPQTIEEQRAGKMRKAFARCIYNRDPKLAKQFLHKSDAIAADYAAAGVSSKEFSSRFGMEDCLSREALLGDVGLRMGLPVMRAMLAEEAYLAANKTAPAPLAADAVLGQRRYVAVGEQLRRAQALGELSDCVTRDNIVKVDVLLRTMPGSTGESAAARALGPAIGSCLYQGQKVSLSIQSIRAYMADGAWQLYGDKTVAAR